MKTNDNKTHSWVTPASLILWFFSYALIMCVVWFSVFTYNQVIEFRDIKESNKKIEQWVAKEPEDIWEYTAILVDRETTWPEWNFTIWDEPKFRSYVDVNLDEIEEEFIEIVYLDKLVCNWIYDKTYKDEWFLRESKNWETAWTLWGKDNRLWFIWNDCHLVACQTVTLYWEPKTQCSISEYFDILQK